MFSNTEAGILASTVFEALEISGRRIEDIERCRPRRDAAGDAARPLNQHDFAVKLPESFIAFKFLLNSAEKLVARREERNGQRHSARAEKQTHNAGVIGVPRGAQAVGNALRRNPVLLMTPCHRVLPASALEAAKRAKRLGGAPYETVGGFSGAMTGPLTDLKRHMLMWEAERFGSAEPALF